METANLLHEQTIAAFERAWLAGQVPDVDQYVTADGEAGGQQDSLLGELVLVDMEFRWKTAAMGGRLHDVLGGQPRLEDYVRLCPRLGPLASLPAEMAAEEYRVRHLWGDRPSHDHFLSRFPDQLTPLVGLLQAADRELAAEAGQLAIDGPRLSLPPAEFDPRAPLLYSDFTIEEHLGSGGMGKVYRATQRSLNRPVALKALHKSRQHDPAAVERFVQEAQLLARLRHPAIVGIHGLGRFPGGGYFLVMDWIEGCDLAARLRRAPVTVSEAVRITAAVAGAVQYAHQQGIVHCDLKPANILLDRLQQVWVADFGFAQFLEGHGTAHQPLSGRGGTFGYAAPEQLDPQAPSASVAVDVFALGALLYTLLTGQPPAMAGELVSHEPTADTTLLIANGLGPSVPKPLAEICLKCMSVQPEERYRSADEITAALAAAQPP